MKKAFGLQIKAAREAKGLTQAELAEKLDLEPGSVAAYEQGRMGIRWRVIEAISEALGQSPSYFFDADQKPLVQKKHPKLELLEIVATFDEDQAKALLSEAKAIAAGLSKPALSKSKPLELNKGEGSSG